MAEELTDREQEILILLAENLSNGEIAAKLHLAVSTVKWYIGQIFSKLGVSSRRQAVAWAKRAGVLPPAGIQQSVQHLAQDGRLLENRSPAAPTHLSAASAAPGTSGLLLTEADNHRVGLPTGTVTFLFTDIQGSTPMWERMPGEMKTALAQHHTLLRSAIEAHGGVVYQVIGDSFQAAFRLAPAGLAAALEAQRALVAAAWGPTGPLRVRMGLHSGPAERDRLGNAPYEVSHTLNRAARIMSAAHGGQILLSQEAAGLVSHELPDGASLLVLGEFHLKGLQRLEHLHQLLAPGLPNSFPPPDALSASQNNLPLQTTAFIGREREIGEVAQLLTHHRLVTLTGSGGTGKTRLGLQVAADVLNRYPHGAWLVELAPLTDPIKIANAAATALGLQESSEAAVLDLLVDYLKSRSLLLVLDNCEHLIEASAALVERLLRASPGLTVLASSREALGIPGEASYRVPSLHLPDPSQAGDLQAVAQTEAVSLFVDRAALLVPGFRLTTENAAAIVEICRRLDGIPLAIELAAARVPALSIDKIAARLTDRFRLLTGGARTALPRQQTLRASIDWSYAQLTPSERLLLQRLSIFTGGCTLEAVEMVCGQAPIEPAEVLDLLSGLVRKSLVVYTGAESPEPRYHLLETIRQYAREKLLDEGGGEDLRGRHLAYYLALVTQADVDFHSPQQRQWMKQLDQEIDNFRAALEWGLASGAPESYPAGLNLASTLCTLDSYWIVLDLNEALRWFDSYQARSNALAAAPPTLRAKMLFAIGIQYYHQSRFAQAIECLRQSLALYEDLSDFPHQAKILDLMRLGTVFYDDGRSSIKYQSQAVQAARQAAADPAMAGYLAYYQASLAYLKGDLETAQRINRQAEEAFEHQGDWLGVLWCLQLYGDVALGAGDDPRALVHYQSVSRLAGEIRARPFLVWPLFFCGDLSYQAENYPAMEAYYQEGQRIGEQIGFRRARVWALHHIGVTARRMGQRARAIALICKGVDLAIEYEMHEMVLECLASLAGLALELGQPAAGARLLGAFTHIRKGVTLGPVVNGEIARDTPMLRAALGTSAFDTAFQEGQQLSWEEAVALGRSIVTENAIGA